MKGIVAVDTTRVVSDSIKEVERTIGEAIIIVIIVIFLFLQDWRATIIPAVTIPVSLIGTFAFIKIFGFSINSLTLFGITLATGLVVDDAIVVIENVQRHLEEGVADCAWRPPPSPCARSPAPSSRPRSCSSPCSFRSASSPAPPASSTSSSRSPSRSPSRSRPSTRSPFRPRSPPSCCAKSSTRPASWASSSTPIDKRAIKKLIAWYAIAVSWVVKVRYVFLVLFVGGLAATVFMYTHVPTAFVPQEDQGYFLIIVQTPPGASLNYTSEFADRVAAKVRKDDDVFGTFSVMGFSLAGGSSPTPASSSLRSSPSTTAPSSARATTRTPSSAASLRNSSPSPAASPSPQSRPPSPASAPSAASSSSCRTPAATPSATSTASPTPWSARHAHPRRTGLVNLNTTFTANDPQLQVTIDREKAKALGVPLSQITTAMGTFMGSSYINDFDFNNRSYRVYVQADRTSAATRRTCARTTSAPTPDR